jgi:hypothetical protein
LSPVFNLTYWDIKAYGVFNFQSPIPVSVCTLVSVMNAEDLAIKSRIQLLLMRYFVVPLDPCLKMINGMPVHERTFLFISDIKSRNERCVTRKYFTCGVEVDKTFESPIESKIRVDEPRHRRNW